MEVHQNLSLSFEQNEINEDMEVPLFVQRTRGSSNPIPFYSQNITNQPLCMYKVPTRPAPESTSAEPRPSTVALRRSWPSDNWQSYGATIRERNAVMFNNGLMSDVSFNVGPKESCQKIPAHKYVLATGSSVFYAMFYGELAENSSAIDIPDVEPFAFLTLLRFVCSVFSDFDFCIRWRMLSLDMKLWLLNLQTMIYRIAIMSPKAYSTYIETILFAELFCCRILSNCYHLINGLCKLQSALWASWQATEIHVH